MAPIDALLFDVDGTLVDSNGFHVLAWQEVFRAAGHDISVEAIHAQVGKGGDNLIPALLPDVSKDEQRRLADAHGPIYRGRYIDRVRPFPGARDLLARAKADGFTVALATSADSDELDHYVRLLDADALVDVTTDKDDVATSKPAPDIFQAALSKAEVSPGSALVIGDSPWDVLAARRAGVATIGLLSGGFSRADLDGAIAIYEGAADLLSRWDTSPARRGR